MDANYSPFVRSRSPLSNDVLFNIIWCSDVKNTEKFQYVMRFRKPWLRVKAVNFDFNEKSSSTDYNEANEPTPKSLAHIKSKKLLVELEVPKIELFHFFTFFALLKSLLLTPSHV